MPPARDIDDAAARITAYETRVRDLARARFGADLAKIQAQFRADITHAHAMRDPAAIQQARRTAATALRGLRPAMAPLLRGALDEGARLGAELAGGALPPGLNPARDDAVKVTLQRMNTPIRRHARLSANAVMRMPLRTETQLQAVLDRITAVLSEVDAAAGVITSRAVGIGTTAVTETQGVARIWVTRTGCCPVCASYSGAIAAPGKGFRPRARYGDHLGQWENDGGGISGPGLHRHCRCYVVPWQQHLADRLARQTEADVAAGRLAASTPARIRAIERMLADDARLTQRTRERAIRAAVRGRFAGQRPADQRRASA